MSYATAQELRSEYTSGASDEFSALLDSELDRALARASSTIDRYWSDAEEAGSLTAASLARIKAVCLTLARSYAHGDRLLDPDHPINRDYREALQWLALLGRGEAVLKRVSGEAVGMYDPVVIAPPRRF